MPPLSDFPSHLSLPRVGSVSLVADYEKAKKGGSVALYIVNRSDSEIQLPTQDGNPYAKLEQKAENNQWRRAQTHRDSWCGNSYFNIEVEQDSFVRVTGHIPETGIPSKVRYRLYTGEKSLELTLNEGTGLVNPFEVAAAGEDDMALRRGDVSTEVAAALM